MPENLDPYIELSFPLSKLFHQLAKFYVGIVSGKLPDLDIDRYYYPVVVIHRHGKINQQLLAREICADKVTTNRIITYLLEKDYITREKNPADRREFFVCLTQKGKTAAAKIDNAFITTNNSCFQGMDKNAQNDFICQIEQVRLNLEKEPKNEVELKYRKLNTIK